MTFSIIIPVYNVAPYLRACLDSIFVAVGKLGKVGGEKLWANESRPLVEVICVDDGSTDGSGGKTASGISPPQSSARRIPTRASSSEKVVRC